MEKTFGPDPGSIHRLLRANELAEKKNLKIGVGLQRHHQLGYIDTINRLHDGAIGDIVSMRCYWNGTTPWVHPRKELEKQYGRPLTEMEYQLRNWYYFVWTCGDHIVEQHIHNLDIGNWIHGAHPIMAQGMGGRQVRTLEPVRVFAGEAQDRADALVADIAGVAIRVQQEPRGHSLPARDELPKVLRKRLNTRSRWSHADGGGNAKLEPGPLRSWCDMLSQRCRTKLPANHRREVVIVCRGATTEKRLVNGRR